MVGFKAVLTATLFATLFLLATDGASLSGDGDAGPAPAVPTESSPSELPPTSLPEKPDAVPVNTTKPKLIDYQESSNK